jgi:hypothetical protein
MKHANIFCLFFFLSCVSIPKEELLPAVNEQPQKIDLARVSFRNFFTDNVYVQLQNGNIRHNIGVLNLNEYGQSTQVSSLISSGKTVSYTISSGYYTIILKKDENGAYDAGGNLFEEFYFPPTTAEEKYLEIHLYPQHKRDTKALITVNGQTDNIPLDPSFTIEFTNDMIRPVVEAHTELYINAENDVVPVKYHWYSSRKLVVRPESLLRPATSYSLYVEVEARTTEAERLLEASNLSFTTGITSGLVDVFDASSVIFDDSNSEYVRVDWVLPSGANGSEIHIINEEGTIVLDLFAKTSYNFYHMEILYKIVPYIFINGGKAYNKTDIERPYNVWNP